MNPYFSREEYTGRHARARELMQSNGLSALFLTSDRNIYYLTGHQPAFPWYSTTRPTLLFLPLDGQPILISHEVWKGAAIRDSWFDDVRGYTSIVGVPTDLIISMFQECNLTREKVGLELGLEQRIGMPAADFAAMRAALPAVEWTDAAGLLWDLRAIKSPAEIECLRTACTAVNHSFENVFPRLRSGMTQEQVVHKLQAAICEGGADVGFIMPTWGGESNLAMSSLPSEERLERGDLICVDMGAVHHGYWSDFSRAASLGRPSEYVLQTWEAIHRVTMKGVEAVGPGVPIGQVVKACAGEARRLNLDMNFAAGRSGHGIGLMLTEPPSMTLEERTILEPGMTITLEPGIVNEAGVFVVEQNMAVTEAGADLLSAGRWEIWTV